MSYIGINIGALTVKVVSLDDDRIQSRVASHRGRPVPVIHELLREFSKRAFFGVSGHLGHISEVAATEAALEHIHGSFDAVASLGGEAFTVYLLEGTRVLSVVAPDKCAAGSGEFFVQQIGRFGLDLQQAIEQSLAGKVVPLASRCSVHCKSDVTHKLNRQEASTEDILHTLHDSMADKVVALLAKGQRPVRRLLVVGGVAQNRAVIASLREKLSKTNVVVPPEGPYFEAMGTALLTRAEPVYEFPNITEKRTLGTLPALTEDNSRVTLIPAPAPDLSAVGPFVLGVDAGSTTTKAVLMDPATRRIVASHCRRTNGDPVGATRQCLRALADGMGNRKIGPVAVTGSARELIGAYLGTSHVYNEISAHAVGAAHFDPQVDTIFEIGGQDSKYILLRNGVPIDYAMNAACSAGTGSFLEECAQGDLGLPLTEIADEALRAAAPVQFKATCAAFINSDIRTALQEGCSREDVTAGLVYSIVQNYLTKVKGPRAIGKRVFFQGGVAMNRAVGQAFAHCLGKHVVIPPHPELLGAIGVALLALERASGTFTDVTDVAGLAVPPIQVLGQFTCRACDNYCAIDRLEVAGRRFPFGGRCSRYESVRRRRGRGVEVVDLVEARNKLIFAPVPSPPQEMKGRIGIPRALTSHSLYLLYSTFFRQLGLEVVLSGIDPAGWSRANSGFCFPVQIAHGAILDLVKGGIDTIFLPHVNRMPNAQAGVDSYLCPITQASPYFISKAFPNVTFLSPVLNFANGYEACEELVELADRQLDFPRPLAERAYREAVKAQMEVERSMQKLGRTALAEASEDQKPTVILVGRSYNAYPAEASQSVAKKLCSLGIRVIPGDCLPRERPGPTCWHYPNIILNAVELAGRHPNLYLLYVSNFSCTIDAFTHSLLSSELGSKPYLFLEIDAHTADAGIQTRLEAFLDVLENYRSDQVEKKPFALATIGHDAMVTASNGRRVHLTDTRVKLYFAAFAHYHSRAIALAARWLGLNVGQLIELDRHHLERGLRYTSGRECLPLPISIGQMLEAHEQRDRDEIVGFYMVRGGAPCVLACYNDYFRHFIEDNELRDLFIFDPHEVNDYYGLNRRKLGQFLASLIMLADLFLEMEQTLRVVGEPGSLDLLRECWNEQVDSARSPMVLNANLPSLVKQVTAIPHTDPAYCPKVVVTGDFFTRLSPSFMGGIHDLYAKHGIILIPVDLNELYLYGAYADMVTATQDWGVPPDSLRALALACAKAFRPEGRNYVISRVRYHQLKYYEERYRRLFGRTGLLVTGLNDMYRLFQHASQHISSAVFGEAIPTVGKALAAQDEGYQGIIVIGPFNCLPFRISEAILKPYCMQQRMPTLTYESDGFSVSPTFLRQVDVHIQQVLGNTPAAGPSLKTKSCR
ncbi:MAG: acyl-CoA dehydratase activase [Planctomycetota bacterium]|jgi:predicted CoA-substrate-specific enzyme activase